MRRNQLLLFLSLTLSGCAAQQGEAPLETPSLPPEPKAPLHEQAHEAPQLEQELAANEAYANLWSLPRDDLNLFLTCISEFLSDHQLGIQQATYDQLGPKNLEEALSKIVMLPTMRKHLLNDL